MLMNAYDYSVDDICVLAEGSSVDISCSLNHFSCDMGIEKTSISANACGLRDAV